MTLKPTRRRKSQPSTIDRLPEETQELIAKLRRNGRTISEIHDHLKGLDVEVSRSAIGRHVRTLAEIGEEMRRAGEMARFVVDEFGEETDERVGRANIAILQGAIMSLLTERDIDEETGAPVRLDAAEAKSISLSLQRLISSQRIDAERQLKLRAEAKREAQEEAARAVDQVGKEQGLSQASVDAVKARILGLSAQA